jgi:tetratricopeptide (TPR) repeat protein
MFTRAIVQQEKALPAAHPNLGIAFLNRGKVRTQRRQLAEARADLDRAHAILEAAKAPEIADALTSLGVVAAAGGQRGEAREFYTRVVTLLRDKPGGETKLAVALNNLGNTELVDGNLAAARTALQEARSLFAAHAGPAHPFTVQNLNSLALLELTDGHAPRAVTILQRALSTARSRESSDAERGQILANLGFAHARARSFDEARAAADEALRLLGTGLDAAESRGYARFALAMAVRATDRAKANELASQARADFEALGSNGQRSLDLLDAWRAR